MRLSYKSGGTAPFACDEGLTMLSSQHCIPLRGLDSRPAEAVSRIIRQAFLRDPKLTTRS